MEKSESRSAKSNQLDVNQQLNEHETIQEIEHYYSVGQLKQAQRLCREFLQYAPDNTVVLRQLGVISHRMGELNESFNCFSRLTKLEPEDDSAFYNLGHTGVMLGNFDLAFAAFAKTIELNPESARAYNNLGVILERRGDFESAADYFYEASYVDDYHVLSRLHLVDCLLVLQRLDDCQQVIDETLRISEISVDQRGDLLVDRAVIAWLKSDIDVCARTIRQARNVVTHMQSPQVYVQSYLDILIKLLEYQLHHSESYKFDYDEVIYFIGDQQCLALQNTLLKLEQRRYQVNAYLVADARVVDFVADKPNSTKVSFQAAIDLIPNKASVLLNFGQADCFAEQGLYTILKQGEQDCLDYLKTTIDQYIQFVHKVCQTRNIKVIIVGIAGHKPEIHSITNEQVQKMQNIVEKFNQYLAKAALAQGYNFLDVYTATLAEHGFCESEFYLTDQYLTIHAYQRAAQQYLQKIER